MSRFSNPVSRLLAGLILVFQLSACGDSFTGVNAVVDGQFWRSDAYAFAAIGGDSALFINAESRDFLPISMRLTQFASADTFALDSINNSVLLGNTVASGYRAIPNRPGTLIVLHYKAPSSSSQGHIKGTFQLRVFNNLGDSLSISEGRFDLSISPLQ